MHPYASRLWDGLSIRKALCNSYYLDSPFLFFKYFKSEWDIDGDHVHLEPINLSRMMFIDSHKLLITREKKLRSYTIILEKILDVHKNEGRTPGIYSSS